MADAVAWHQRDHHWSVTTTHSERTTLALRNRTGEAQAIWAAFRVGPGSEVQGELRTEIDPQRGWTWVVVEGAPGPSTHDVVVRYATTERHDADALDATTYRHWANRGLADASGLRRAATLRERLEDVDTTRADLEGQQQRLGATLKRLRDDLQAADGSATRALTRKIASVEQDVQRNGERLAELEAQRQETLSELHAVLDSIGS